MVGFIGKQHLLSSNGGFAEPSYSSATLSNGNVLTAYMASGSGFLRFFSFNPKTDTSTFLGGTGSIVEGFKHPTVFALDKGKFAVIVEEDAEESNHNQISLMKFNADGTQSGNTKALASGYLMEMQNAISSPDGYFVAYRDRETGVEHPYIGQFFNNAGKLIRTYNFDGGGDPNFETLKNGNLLAVWKQGANDATFGQIFKSNGKPVGDQFLVSDDGVIYDHDGTAELHATDDGGFLTVYKKRAFSDRETDTDIVYIQKFNKSGDKKGNPVTFDSKVDGVATNPYQMEIAVTNDGLIAVTYAGSSVTGTGGDVYLVMLSPTGKLVFGPTVIHDPLTDTQSDPHFVEFANGKLMITLNDQNFVPFGYQESIQGVELTEPDYFWEGDNKANTETGTNGEDILVGFGGNDKISGGKGEDYIKGGAGNDLLFGGDKADLLFGEAGNDTLNGDAGGDFLYGGQDDDTLKGGGGGDQLFGGEGKDALFGGGGGDTLNGADGKDTLNGDAGQDLLYGGLDTDKVIGGGGRDQVYGDEGNDKLYGGGGDDNLYGGDGNDLIKGGAGNDYVQGSDGNDRAYGDAGNDQIYSGAGNDREYGGAGNDTIYDSDGNDRLFGGDGADTFSFRDTDFGKDKILDFEFGIDTLDMGYTAYGLQSAGAPAIQIIDTDAGVLFKVNNDHSVLVVNADLSDFMAGDYITDSPF